MIKPIRNKTQYKSYLKRAYELLQLDLKPKSNESDELEVLSILIEKYESEEYPIDAPNPIEAIKFRLEQSGKSNADLIQVLGSKSRASEILSGKRKLSLKMIRRLNEFLHIPALVLIQDYELAHSG